MGSDLTELRERLAFAEEEISTLASEVALFTKSGFSGVRKATARFDAFDVYFSQNKPVPTRIKSRAGTIANEVRSCLDGLACALAIRNGKTTGGTYFPISKSLEIFNDDGMKKIRKLSLADQEIIIDMRPYREASPLLFGLHEADRTRKHTRLAGCGSANSQALFGGGAIAIAGGAGARITGTRLNGVYVSDMNYLGRRVTADVGREVLIATGVPGNLPFDITVDLAYMDPPEIAGRALVPTLSDFVGLANGVIDKFAPRT